MSSVDRKTYMAKLRLNQMLADHDVSLPADLYDEIIAALREQAGARGVLSNPWTGKPRDYRDVNSDPEGVLCVEPGAPLKAAPDRAGLTVKAVTVPVGYVLVPEKFGISADAWEAAAFAYGGPATGEGESYMDCTAWVGYIEDDEGAKRYGLHVSCDECPEEGSITVAEFPEAAPSPPVEKAARGVVDDAIRHLSKWLDMAECECESGHQRGRSEVEDTRNRLLALAAAQQPGQEGGGEFRGLDVTGRPIYGRAELPVVTTTPSTAPPSAPVGARPSRDVAEIVIGAYLLRKLGAEPEFDLTEDGEDGWAFWITADGAEGDTTSYLHADLRVEWLGTCWEANALAQQPAQAAPGWKLVPVEPTEAMLDSGCEQHECEQGDPYYRAPPLSEGDARAIYAAMLAASPSPPVEQSCTCPSGDGSLRWPCPTHPPGDDAAGGGHGR